MKLQCDQCGTKYAIRDDKVRGRDRVFKIRCKSCSSIITIHGVEAGGEPAAPAVAETPEWYYAKDGQQVGPVTKSAMHDAVRAGSIKADTYVWRKEMDGWAAASEVPLLADMLSTDESAIPEDLLDAIAFEAEQGRAPPEPEPAHAAAQADPVASALADIAAVPSSESMGDRTIEAPSPWASQGESWAPSPAARIVDPRASHGSSFDSTMVDQPWGEQPRVEQPRISPASRSDDLLDKPTVGVASSATLDDLFQDDAPPKPRIVAAPRSESLFGDAEDDSDGVVSSSRGAPAPADDGDDAAADNRASDGMLYQRHDNSVLFSLSEVDSEKKDREPEKKAKALQALTADSGLIDIRSFSKKKKDKKEEKGDLFAAISGEEATAARKVTTTSEAAMPAFKPSAAAIPVIQRKKKNGAMYAAIAFGIVAAAAVTTMVVMNVMKTEPPAPAPAPAVAVAPPTKEEPKAADAKPATATAPAATPAPTAPTPAAAQPAVAPAVAAGQPTQPTPAAPAEGQPAAAGQPPAVADASPPAEVAKVEAPKAPEVPLTPEEKRAKEKRDKERAEKMKLEKEARDLAKAEKEKADKEKAEQLAKADKEKKEKSNEPSGNDLLQQLGQAKKAEPEKTEAGVPGGDELPEQLTSTQIKKCVAKAIGRIRSCAKDAGESGTSVSITFTVTPGGSVTGASASGTSASGCVVGAVSSLHCGAAKNPKTVSIPIPIP